MSLDNNLIIVITTRNDILTYLQHEFKKRILTFLLTNFILKIVGGGSGGAVVAGRLSEIEGFTVLLLEAGDAEPVTSTIPWFHTLLPGSTLDWKYETVPQKDILFAYDRQVCHFHDCVNIL